MVKLCKNWKPVTKHSSNAPLTRRNLSSKQKATLNSSLVYIRARYYNAQLGQFISRDPLGYVDGMSQYRAYFVPGGVDPSGSVSRVYKPEKPHDMPWASVGSNLGQMYGGEFRHPDDNGVDPGAYGDTNLIHYFVDCGCQCNSDCTYKLRCGVVFYAQIRINEWYSRGEGQDIKGVYGHEQQHIANLIRAANFVAYVASRSEQKHQSVSKADCEARRDFDEERLNGFLQQAKQWETDHHFPHPKAGSTDYEPWGTMPAKSDSSFPGVFEDSFQWADRSCDTYGPFQPDKYPEETWTSFDVPEGITTHELPR